MKTAEALGLPDARTAIWLYRLPSLIGGIAAVLATYWCALPFVSRRGAILAAVMIAASILLGVEARLARVDAVLDATIIAAMGALARLYLVREDTAEAPGAWRAPAVFWTALAAGILIKGPVIVMIVALAAATVSIIDRSARWLKRLRPLVGLAWFAALTLPWFVAIYARAGAAFFVDSIGRDLLAKAGTGPASHHAPPGLYFVLYFATFFPGSILSAPAAPAVWAARRERPVRFLLAWLVPSWIAFELIATKLPHYVLPLYPAIAILMAGVVEKKMLWRARWLKIGTAFWFVAPLILGAGAVAAALAIAGDPVVAAWPFLIAAIVCGLLAWRRYDDGAEPAVMWATAAVAFIGIGLYAFIIPALVPLFPSVPLADALRHSGCAQPTVASAGYQEPSLVFLAGANTRFVDGASAADFLRQGECRVAFVEAHELPAFAARAEAIGLRYQRQTSVTGFDYSDGEHVDIAVFHAAQ